MLKLSNACSVPAATGYAKECLKGFSFIQTRSLSAVTLPPLTLLHYVTTVPLTSEALVQNE